MEMEVKAIEFYKSDGDGDGDSDSDSDGDN